MVTHSRYLSTQGARKLEMAEGRIVRESRA